MNFGKRLKCARHQRGFTQLELANLCNMPPSLISHYETGKREPTLKNFTTLVKVLQWWPADYYLEIR